MVVYCSPLERYRSTRTNLISADGNSETNLTGHRSTTYDRLVELQGFDNGGNSTNVGVFVISMGSWVVCLVRKTAAMTWKIKSNHVTLFEHLGVIHNTMVLSAVRTSGMQEDNVLVSGSTLLKENFAAAPGWGLDINVATSNMVNVSLGLHINGLWSTLCFVKDLEGTAPEMSVLCERSLVTENLDAVLLDVHAKHTPVGLVWGNRNLLKKFLPLLWESRQSKDGGFVAAGGGASLSGADCDEDGVVRSSSLDAKGERSGDGCSTGESLELGICLKQRAESWDCGSKLRRQIRPFVCLDRTHCESYMGGRRLKCVTGRRAASMEENREESIPFSRLYQPF